MTEYKDLEGIIGETISSVYGLEKDSEEVRFTTESGRKFRMIHHRDCCESVWLEDFDGEESDVSGYEVLSAYESTEKDLDNDDYESVTWTFYTINTTGGSLWLRWCGERNGYYSEDVCFEEIK